MDVATLLALSNAEYQVQAVKGWAEAFGQELDLKPQFNLVREEGIELPLAGMALAGSKFPETVAEWLMESADFAFVLAGMARIPNRRAVERDGHFAVSFLAQTPSRS